MTFGLNRRWLRRWNELWRRGLLVRDVRGDRFRGRVAHDAAVAAELGVTVVADRPRLRPGPGPRPRELAPWGSTASGCFCRSERLRVESRVAW